jgi:peptidase MA superfamily protein
LDEGRFTVVAFPQDLTLAHAVLARATTTDTFPGLPRPTERVLIAIAPDHRRFREWSGAGAPEWGAAVAIPDERRIVMQGSDASSRAGDPMQVLRHELAHLALHEYLGDLPPRWFDEGYASVAAGEWDRDAFLTTSVGLVLHGIPSLDSLDAEFEGGESRASGAYALSYRAVAELSSLDPQRGLALFFQYWRQTKSIDVAIRRAYGMTEDAFEQRWRDHTMRRYGALAIMANMSLILGLLGIIILPLYVMRRRRDQVRLEALRRAEAAAERAAQTDALTALLATGQPEPPSEEPRASSNP